ncbi:hypothetical protein QYE76_001990 [Lolium multiflorum]|uniref:Reverse transcriptase zinc-binding domain-containing protein n=1 Tax=Lolium multiflorum TaxID=4521 RepID=A0AAD8VXG6_LOLMU|nr:hypothetical protein QYE76_001990 [Lolium multiflorum]
MQDRSAKIFAYLLDIDRLRTRANLFYKHCTPSELCASCPTAETGRHLLFDCSLAASVWTRLEVSIPEGQFSIWDICPPLPDSGSHLAYGGCDDSMGYLEDSQQSCLQRKTLDPEFYVAPSLRRSCSLAMAFVAKRP